MFTVTRPVVQDVTITPNLVSANTSYLIAVAVTEIIVELEPIIMYCGSFACGEEGEII